jgi:ribosome-binding protein aMBF1 (putative translation factor)
VKPKRRVRGSPSKRAWLRQEQVRLAQGFITHIRDEMQRVGMNHKDLAVRLGVSEAAISQLFNPATNAERGFTLRRMAEVAAAVGLRVTDFSYGHIPATTKRQWDEDG